MKENTVITGLGVVSALGIGVDDFWQALQEGRSAVGPVTSFEVDKFKNNIGAEIKNFNAGQYLGPKGLRNMDNNTLFLLVAAKQAIENAKLEITNANSDDFGVCTGSTFAHFWSIVEFDREVFIDGLEFSNPALFPSNVLNAASSQVSIRHNIQGFNTTISTGYTSFLEALKYSQNALEMGNANCVLCAAVDTLSFPLYFGFHQLGYMAGLKGEAVSCPFDKRRNGPVLGEAACMMAIEKESQAKSRGVPILAQVRGLASYFDGFRQGKIHPQGLGLEAAIKLALDESGVSINNIDYISSCANSTADMDKIESLVLKKIFGKQLKNIPVSSIKSMLGETVSVSGGLQALSCIGAMKSGFVPPTINIQEQDPECDIDCVTNKAQKKDVKIALVLSFGPGGYNSACVLERR